MIESIEKVKIEDKFISDEDVDPAIHDITVKRNAKYPDIEIEEDKTLTPKQVRDKYEKRFAFQTETLVTKVWDLLTELHGTKEVHYVGKGINNCLFFQTNKSLIHDEFNRFEMQQVYEIIEWCYQI
jgi:hypothetical protein